MDAAPPLGRRAPYAQARNLRLLLVGSREPQTAQLLLGVDFCQVQGETPKKAKIINDKWMVKGHRGTNLLKAKTKSIKAQKIASSSIKECAAARDK